MITVETWKKAREMYFREKKKIKRIAKKLNISKNTVRKYIRSNEEPVYHRGKIRERKVQEYDSFIKECLKKELIGSVIYEKLQEQGYEGSANSLYRYLNDLGWHAEKDITTRFETEPGRQMQYDWCEWQIKIGGQEFRIYVHCLILSYSRMKYYSISLDKSSESVIKAILGGMEYFCGYCENLLIDNGKSMILNHNTKKRGVEFSEDFTIFTVRHNIKAQACYPYRAQTKGKVEKPFQYIQEHLLRGLEVETIEELELKLIKFNDKVNSNFHRGINRTPCEAFEDEKLFLKPYERMDLSRIFVKEFRKVTRDGYISYKTNFYPVPMKYCYKSVFIENVMGKTLNIYKENMELLESYSIKLGIKNYRPEHPEHVIMRNKMQEKVRRIKSEVLKNIIKLFGSDGEAYIQGVEEKKGPNSYYHITTLLDYVEVYGEEIVRHALKSCLEIKLYDKDAIKILLRNKVPEAKYIPIGPIDIPAQKIRNNLGQYKVLRRLPIL